jgi:hypothetical protein
MKIPVLCHVRYALKPIAIFVQKISVRHAKMDILIMQEFALLVVQIVSHAQVVQHALNVLRDIIRM